MGGLDVTGAALGFRNYFDTMQPKGNLMNATPLFTIVIKKEGNGFVSLCPELDVASQGDDEDEARSNLKEAVGLFLEMADESEVVDRKKRPVITTGP